MPMLTCPNDPEHKEFVMHVMVPETWILNEDGDCEEITEGDGGIESCLTNAYCNACSIPAENSAEDK